MEGTETKNNFTVPHDFPLERKKTYVRVSQDESEAWLYLMPRESGEPYDKADLIGILREQGVTDGIDEDKLIAMARKQVYEREIKVAAATPPTEGKDGYYQYLFDTSDEAKKPEIREDGSVDYQSMNMINNVKKGDPLAIYHPAIPGTPGHGVKGTEIPARAVRNLRPLRGKGIEQAQKDENIYLASEEGKVEYRNGMVSVIGVYEVSGDIDQIIGRVEFFGHVHILGNVEAGVTIRAGKSLTIDGTIESANLFAGGDMILKRGIQGNQKAEIVCRGNLYADFIEHSKVKVGGDVEANIILNSQIDAEGRVRLDGKKGALIGGNVHGTKGIECKELGNDSEVRTIVHAGCPPEVAKRMHQVMKEEAEIRSRLKELLSEVKQIEAEVKETRNLTPEKAERIMILKKEKRELDEQEAQEEMEKHTLQQKIDSARNAVVRIDGKLYRGSVICIDQSRMLIDNNTVYMEYRCIAGMIAGKVIVKN